MTPREPANDHPQPCAFRGTTSRPAAALIAAIGIVATAHAFDGAPGNRGALRTLPIGAPLPAGRPATAPQPEAAPERSVAA